jgi:soluble lytic murein transglycosylase
LQQVSNAVIAKNDCVPSGVSAALGFKLEENFPKAESVELVKKLYRKGADCGKNAASAHAAFRLSLIHIWQNRCADIPELVAKIEATPEGAQYQARARYWRYHCAGVVGTETEKRNAKAVLTRHHPFSFQALAAMGADELALARLVRSQPPQVSMRSVVRPDLNPMIRASEALFQIGSSQFAAELLDRSTNEVGTLEPEVRLYLAVLLNRTHHALPKFKILTALFQDDMRMVSVDTLKLMFPLWYYDNVKSSMKTVDPLLVLSLMRQESAFNREAKSIAGARGLMQVMPATARMVASVRAHRLDDPTTNIAVGVKYLLKRLDQYSGDVELTLAAYNAGFARVDDWRRRYPTENKMLFLDFIPFKETREYVSAILRNYYWYTKLYSPVLAPTVAAESKINAIIGAQAGIAAVLSTKK